MEGFVPLSLVAEAAGTSVRAVERAIDRQRADTSAKWRGARLVIQPVRGRGGRSGLQYLVQVASLPEEVRTRLERPSSAQGKPSSVDHGRKQRDWFAGVLDRICVHPKNSEARGKAIAEAALTPYVAPNGQWCKLSKRTIQRLVGAYEAGGLGAIGRRQRSDKGTKRVFVSTAWSRAVPFDDAVKARIEASLKDYVRAQHKNGESQSNILFKASNKMHELSLAEGIGLTPKARVIPHAFVKSEAVYRRVHEYRRDRKAFEDDKPGVRRSIGGLEPMDVVVGDVHHLDFKVQKVPGYQEHPKAIAWLDLATNRIWLDVILLEEGRGVTNGLVIASFLRMLSAWGMPKSLYLDNGSEYHWSEFVDDAMKLSGLRLDYARRDSNIVRAKAYNARAKAIEGVFGVLERHHFAKLPGWIGGDRQKSKRANVGRAPDPFPGPFEQFRDAIGAAVAFYHNRPQNGRALEGLSPYAALQRAVDAGWTMTRVEEEAFVAAFSTEEARTVRQGRVQVGGDVWTCPELQGCLDMRVSVLIPKYVGWSRLPIKSNKGELLGFAERDIAFNVLDPAGAREADRRGKRRLMAVRALERSAPDIDPLAETLAFAPKLPAPPLAPVGATLTASNEAKAIARGVAGGKPDKLAARRRAEEESALASELVARLSRQLGGEKA